MPAGIFLIRGEHELVELNAQPYAREDHLQELLARYPNLLAGDQMNSTAPRRWLLVRREAPVPDSADGGGRWSLDHLFLDQDGVPTLVEVKRSSDTRARREVVAQMLDYAANAVAYWPVEAIRAAFEQRAEDDRQDPDQLLNDLLGSEADVDAFWAKVKVNLQAGRVRMVFVADEIAPELRRIVEFLNVQMDPAEVLAVEVRQYVGAEFRGLVPRLLGQTEEATQRKAASGPRQQGTEWDEESFFASLASVEPTNLQPARELYEWLRIQPGVQAVWGRGVQFAAIHFAVQLPTRLFKFLYLKAEGRGLFTPNIEDMKYLPGDVAALREGWVKELNKVEGMNLSASDKYPNREIALLRDPAQAARFRDALGWLFATLRTLPTENAVA